MNQLDRLEEKLQQGIEWQRYGDLLSFFHGTGLEVEDFRTYQAGDSPKSINWKLSAKHDELRINRRQEEKDIHVDIFLDINANRSAGVRQTNRSIVQQRLADYILFARKWHLTSTKVYTPLSWVLHTYICNTPHAWMRYWSSLEQQVTLAANSTQYTSMIAPFLEQQVSHSKQRVLLLFSDFLWVEGVQQEQLAYLDSEHIVAQIMLDVPDIVGKNFITI